MAMNFEGQYHDPLGLNWLPMLVLYSNIGKKSNSDTKTVELGKELKNLHGKHEVVIDGISKQLDTLIRQKANINLNEDDMRDLKKEIVAKLGEAASTSNAQSSAPVSCDHNGIVFDETTLTVLAGVVDKSITDFHRDNRLCDDSLKKFESRLTTFFTENFNRVLQSVEGSGGTYEEQEYYPPEIYRKNFEDIVEMFMKGDPVLYIHHEFREVRAAMLSERREEVVGEKFGENQLRDLIEQRVKSWTTDSPTQTIQWSTTYLNTFGTNDTTKNLKPIEILRLMYTFIAKVIFDTDAES